MKKVILSIGGMSCSACSSGLEKYLNKQEGIKASVNLVLAQALVEYDETKVNVKQIEEYIKEAGFESLGIYNPKKENRKNMNKLWLILFGILTLVTMYVSMGEMFNIPVPGFISMDKSPIVYSILLCIFAICALIYGKDILITGVKRFIKTMPNMDTLVTLGVLASFIYSFINMILVFTGKHELVHNLYFEACVSVVFFVKLGRYIDYNSKEKTKEAIKDLVKITPEYAIIKTKDGDKKVTIDEVKVGDILICKAGDRVAVDGTVISGSAHVDESFITGESLPRKKVTDSKVIAGSINYDGYFEYRAERIGKDSTISEIVHLVSEASNTKPKIAKYADYVCGIFVAVVIGIAIFTLCMYIMFDLGVKEGIKHFVNVLVVACPCALGLATPLAVVISEGKLAKRGILVKSSDVLETANKINTVVMDKTGTLTNGEVSIYEVLNYTNDIDNVEIMQIVGSLERHSTHPIAYPFIKYLDEIGRRELDVEYFEELPGVGIRGKVGDFEYYVGNGRIFQILGVENKFLKNEERLASAGCSIMYVIKNFQVIALIGVKDTIRKGSYDAMAELFKMDKKFIMLTGDNGLTAKTVANELNIYRVIANVLPKDKTEKIRELIDNGKYVMMVGDGINDAPALATATIGVSMHSGTDIAQNSADVILMNNDISSIAELFRTSKKTLNVIKSNMFWAFAYNIVMITIASGMLERFGLSLTPMYASMAMMFSSITVILNSFRLKR